MNTPFELFKNLRDQKETAVKSGCSRDLGGQRPFVSVLSARGSSEVIPAAAALAQRPRKRSLPPAEGCKFKMENGKDTHSNQQVQIQNEPSSASVSLFF